MELPLEEANAAAINNAIDTFFTHSIKQASEVDPSYQQLWVSLHQLICHGGKRLRPRMVLLAYDAFGGQELDTIIPVAVAQELLHFCLLIHDDVIDRDYVRYGTANIAGSYKAIYSEFVKTQEDLTHYAHSAAILGGDLMLSAAYQMILTSELTADEKMTAQSFLNQGIFDVAGGELLDTELGFMPLVDGKAIKVARYKTAGYSFLSPLMTGAVLAGASTAQIEALRTYATCLGIAYQLVDDLLGVFGDATVIGKSTSSDITEGKKTYMVEQAFSVMTNEQKVAFEKWFGNINATEEGVAAVKALIESTGAKQATHDMVTKYANDARKAVGDMGLDTENDDKFIRLIQMVTERAF